MDEIVLKAYAKINITLDVVGKRDDGYHLLKMIMQNVNLFDIVRVRKTDKKEICITSNRKNLPRDRRNIAFKAAEKMIDKFGIKYGVSIDIKKYIPIAAGLAGGSTDAAAVLKAMNSIFDLKLSTVELCNIGAQLGADVPYCILACTSLAGGIGDEIELLKPLPKMYVVLAKPKEGVSTSLVYKNYNAEKVTKHPETEKMKEAVNSRDLKAVAKGLCNVLESVTIPMCPIIKDIKDELIKNGAVNALMSGSGTTVFGIFDRKEEADEAAFKIKKKFNIFQVYSTYTING